MAVGDPVNTFSTLNGLFKDTYADNLENLLPKGLVIQSELKWADKSKMPGNKFHQPVLLGHEHGFTYAGAASGAFTIGKAIAGRTEDATIVGTQMLLRSQIDYEAAARASSGGKRSFRRALDVVVENMFQSSRKRMEIDYIYGGEPLAVVESETEDTGVFTVVVDSTNWAAGFWAGMEGAKLQAFTSANNYGGAYTVTAVDLVDDGSGNYGLTLTQTADHATALTTGDKLFFDSAGNDPSSIDGFTGTTYSSNVFVGIFKALNDTYTDDAGSTLWGLKPFGNSLWAPNKKAAGGPVTYELITDAIAEVVAKGLDEDLSLYIAPKVWADLVQAEDKFSTSSSATASGGGVPAQDLLAGGKASRVIYGSGGGSRTIGSNGISFITQAGTVTVKPSNYIKESHGFMIAPRLWKRIGATDLTFRLPDRGDEFFLHLTEQAGYELRAYVNHALFTKAPAKSILLTGITS